MVKAQDWELGLVALIPDCCLFAMWLCGQTLCVSVPQLPLVKMGDTHRWGGLGIIDRRHELIIYFWDLWNCPSIWGLGQKEMENDRPDNMRSVKFYSREGNSCHWGLSRHSAFSTASLLMQFQTPSLPRSHCESTSRCLQGPEIQSQWERLLLTSVIFGSNPSGPAVESYVSGPLLASVSWEVPVGLVNYHL